MLMNFFYLKMIFFHHLITNLLYKEWLLYYTKNLSCLRSRLILPSLTQTFNWTLLYHHYMLLELLVNSAKIIWHEEINKKGCRLARQQTELLINFSLRQQARLSVMLRFKQVENVWIVLSILLLVIQISASEVNLRVFLDQDCMKLKRKSNR